MCLWKILDFIRVDQKKISNLQPSSQFSDNEVAFRAYRLMISRIRFTLVKLDPQIIISFI